MSAAGLGQDGRDAILIGMTAPSTVFDLLLAGAPNDFALAAPGRRSATYDCLRKHAVRTIGGLRDRGVGRGDRVAIVLPGGPEAAAAFVSVATGAVAAPLNPAYTEREFAFYLSDLGIKALMLTEGCDSRARSAAAALDVAVLEIRVQEGDPTGTFRIVGAAGCDRGKRAGEAGSDGMARPSDPARPNDTALVLHTSGTTSRPKVVPLLHRNLCASALHIREALSLVPGDRCLNVMPLFHIHGLAACVLGSLAAGACVYCAPGFDALKFFGWMDDCVPTWYSAVPAMHQAVLARAARNPEAVARARLRFVRSSSAALPTRVARELEETFGAPVLESYGMTEAAHQMTCSPLLPARRKLGTVGPAAGPEMSVMDEDGVHLPPGETGEIVVRGPNVTPGYENNPAANEAAFTNGWFRTGDQGFRDEDGCFAVTGRLKEIINRGGEKVSPREVDEVLMQHAGVRQAVTFAIPHPKLGEEVAAAVVLREGALRAPKEETDADRESAAPDGIRAFASERLAAFKVPREIVIMDAIPTGPTGKVQRIGLAERLGLGATKDTSGTADGEHRAKSGARAESPARPRPT